MSLFLDLVEENARGTNDFVLRARRRAIDKVYRGGCRFDRREKRRQNKGDRKAKETETLRAGLHE